MDQHKIKDACFYSMQPLLDWKDLAVVICIVFIVLGAVALYTASESFSIIKGKVVAKGVIINVDGEGRPYFVKTISMLIENDDRVFGIKKGTVVEYRVSDADDGLIDIGNDIQVLVSRYQDEIRILEGPSARM